MNLLTSGTVASGPAFVPSPPLLAIAATLLIHPVTTTRAKTPEEKEASCAALRLLRLTNTLIGPIAGKFDIAFSFTHFESSRHGTRRRVTDAEEFSSDLHNESKPLNIDLAQSGALWSRAEDFWHAVGWSFNCSVLHPERWEKWQLWIQFMCEVLEDDWNERVRRFDCAEEEHANKAGNRNTRENEQILKESLIFKYITTGSVGYGQNRRILRAIFANGSSTSVNEFREVFKNELKKAKTEVENPRKREVEVNIEEDKYGDYLSDGDEGESEEAIEIRKEKVVPRRSKRTKRNTRDATDQNVDTVLAATDDLHVHGGVSLFGGLSSLALRQRFLYLLSAVSDRLPTGFITLEDLYHLFVENIRHLPLPVFQEFILPSSLPYFSPAAQTTLCEYLLFRMRESSAPDTNDEYLNQDKLEQCFLPFAASTSNVIDNAKMSITLESLIILLAESGLLKVTPSLKQAVENGILARAEKAQLESKKNRKVEDVAWSWLLESAERLTFLVNEVLV